MATTLTPIGVYRNDVGTDGMKPVNLFPPTSTVTEYSCDCFSDMACGCGPSVARLPNLSREFKNLLPDFIDRLPPLTARQDTERCPAVSRYGPSLRQGSKSAASFEIFNRSIQAVCGLMCRSVIQKSISY